MNKQLLKILNSLVGLSVLAMFAVAIIAGQARANLPDSAVPGVGAQQSMHVQIILSLDDARYLDIMPVLVKTVSELPLHIVLDSK